MQRLYDLGARRVLVTGTGPLGCAPAELATRSRNGECSVELQRGAALYNPQLEQMLQRLNRKLGSDIFIAANTAQMHKDFVTNPTAYGTNILYIRIYCQLSFSTTSFSLLK
jgi:phospholipase/lecithinase/hemolysin